MRCQKCDYENREKAIFCKNCGTKLDKNTSNIIIHPTIDFILSAFRQDDPLNKNKLVGKKSSTNSMLVFIMLFSVAGVFKAVISSGANSTQGIIIGLIILYSGYIIAQVIKYIYIKKRYENIKYELTPNKLIATNIFLNRDQKEIPYEMIREVVVKQTRMQRRSGVGHIIIKANTEREANIKLIDIKKPYNVMEEIIKKQKEKEDGKNEMSKMWQRN